MGCFLLIKRYSIQDVNYELDCFTPQELRLLAPMTHVLAASMSILFSRSATPFYFGVYTVLLIVIVSLFSEPKISTLPTWCW